MKLHIPVIQRNGVDIFITSKMKMKLTGVEKVNLCNRDAARNQIKAGLAAAENYNLYEQALNSGYARLWG